MMNEKMDPEKKGRSNFLAYGLYIVAAMAMSFLFIHFISHYYHFYDIGINDAANSWWFFFFYMPFAFALCLAISGFIFHHLKKRNIGSIKAFWVGLSAMPVIIAGLFFLDLLFLGDYPRVPLVENGHFGDFLKYYWQSINKTVFTSGMIVDGLISAIYNLFVGGIILVFMIVFYKVVSHLFKKIKEKCN